MTNTHNGTHTNSSVDETSTVSTMSSCASPKAKDKFVLEHEMGSVDKADKLVGKHGSTLLSQAIERKCVEDMVADLWNHHSKLNEALCSNGDQWGVYQTPTTGSFVKLWNGLLAYPWFKELGEKRLKVADIGSGMNAFCTIGSLLTGRIGVAVGLEASEHRCFLAADTALGLIEKGFAFKSLFGFFQQDFESPNLSVRGADLLFFWDRAYNTEVSIFYHDVLLMFDLYIADSLLYSIPINTDVQSFLQSNA